MDAQSLQVVQDLALKDVLEIDFSPKGTFLSTWQRQSMLWVWIVKRGGRMVLSLFINLCAHARKNWIPVLTTTLAFSRFLVKTEDGSHKNMAIHEVKTGQELTAFSQKSQNNW